MEQSKNNNLKTRRVRQDLSWHIVASYLEHIEIYISLFRDKEFERLFTELNKYVTNIISVPNNIVDYYVIIEHTT